MTIARQKHLFRSGTIDEWSSRVYKVSAGGTAVANYDYLGSSRLIGTELSQAWAENKYFAYSGGSHSYSQLDQFGRVITSDWFRTGVTGRDSGLIANSIAYDQSSNITSVTDEVHNNDNGTNVKGLFDVVYTNDELGRLQKADSGNMVSGAIESGSRKRYEEWSLDATGNWLNDKLDLDGDNNFNETGERDATNTFDLANKYTLRNAKSQGQNAYYHDGNQLKYALLDGSPVKQGYRYDAFGRMVEYTLDVTNNDPDDARAKYRYNGLNQRIMWQYDVNANSALTDEERYYFVYDSKWRVVASMRDEGSANPDSVSTQEAFVYHAAGFAGQGGSSYIDSVILRDTNNFKWAEKSNGVLGTRTFYVQNWRSDVMAILDSDGNPLERVRYTAYGTPTSHPIADINGDGTVNATDQSQWSALVGGTSNSAVYAIPDLNADGLFPDDADTTFFDQQYTRVGAGSGFGMNKLSSVGSRKGYAGYEWDGSITSWRGRTLIRESQSGVVTELPVVAIGGIDTRASTLAPSTGVEDKGPSLIDGEQDEWRRRQRELERQRERERRTKTCLDGCWQWQDTVDQLKCRANCYAENDSCDDARRFVDRGIPALRDGLYPGTRGGCGLYCTELGRIGFAIVTAQRSLCECDCRATGATRLACQSACFANYEQQLALLPSSRDCQIRCEALFDLRERIRDILDVVFQ